MSPSSPQPLRHTSEPLTWLRKVVMSAIAIVIVYGNLSMIFNPSKLGVPLPNPWFMTRTIQDAFLLTGMFSSYADQNIDFVIGGRTVPQASGEQPKWIVLDLNEMIPGRMGIKFTQLLVARHWDILGKRAQEAAWHQAAKKMRARHNRLHPDQPIDAVRLGVMRWPLSPDGYRAAKPKKSPYLDWYNDETYKP